MHITLFIALTGCSGSGSTPTTIAPAASGDTGASTSGCQVQARDGEVRDCLDDVVYCDGSPENHPIWDECRTCLGDNAAWEEAWLSKHEATDYDTFQVCQDVALPNRPPTCDPFMVGAQSAVLEPLNLDPFNVWSDDTRVCMWRRMVETYTYTYTYENAQVPARITDTGQLEPHLLCREGSTGIPVPIEAHDALGLSAGDELWLRSTGDGYVIGLYDELLLIDRSCPQPNFPPGRLNIEAYRMPPSTPTFA